ncbi:hypothetical protein ACVNPX_16140 [Staphylococcus aureus]
MKEAFANVKANEESKKLFDEFRETQINFQQKQNPQVKKLLKKIYKKRKNKRKQLKKMKTFCI